MASVMIVDDSDAIRMVLKDIVTIGKHHLAGELQNGEGVLARIYQIKTRHCFARYGNAKKRWCFSTQRNN